MRAEISDEENCVGPSLNFRGAGPPSPPFLRLCIVSFHTHSSVQGHRKGHVRVMKKGIGKLVLEGKVTSTIIIIVHTLLNAHCECSTILFLLDALTRPLHSLKLKRMLHASEMCSSGDINAILRTQRLYNSQNLTLV